MGAPSPRAALPLFLSGPVAQKGLSGAPGNSRKTPPLNIALSSSSNLLIFFGAASVCLWTWVGCFPVPSGCRSSHCRGAFWAQCHPSRVLQQLAVLSHVHSGHSLEGVLEAAVLAVLKLWAVSFSYQRAPCGHSRRARARGAWVFVSGNWMRVQVLVCAGAAGPGADGQPKARFA